MFVLKRILRSLLSRVWCSSNLDSKTQIATAGSIPTATAAALMLIQTDDPVMQMMGGICMACAAALVIYKDDDDD